MTYWILLLAQAWAEGGHGEHAAAQGHDAIPWSSLWVQFFNFTLLLVVLGVLLRKTVRAHFDNRAKEYKQLVARAENARNEAEKGRREIQDRLSKLESGAEKGLAQAQSEAEELRGRMLSEANSLSEKLRIEAQRTVELEIEKAKAQLRSEILAEALAATGESFKQHLNPNEQKRLQKEFADKIQVVSG
ncbi:MAG: hypothetical protein AB7F86_16400 [Bdellovibrionales bacterium]